MMNQLKDVLKFLFKNFIHGDDSLGWGHRGLLMHCYVEYATWANLCGRFQATAVLCVSGPVSVIRVSTNLPRVLT